MQYGAALQQLLDLGDVPDDAPGDMHQRRFYDVLSWDPRGVNHTTPVHPGIADPERLREWAVREESLGWSLEQPEVFNKVWSRHELYGRAISQPKIAGTRPDDEHVGTFVSTAVVVRDMVEIIERHGEWRSKEARRLLRHMKRGAAAESAAERTAWVPGKEKLQYWGISYGTVIAQTFASMYPSRVGRVVADGVVDADDYMAMSWSSNLWDIDNITANFTQACVAAGADLCPIAQWAPGNSDKLLEEIHRQLDTLKESPLTTLAGENDPMLISHSMVVELLFVEWYNGFAGYRRAAELLGQLAAGNASFFTTRREPYSCARPGAFAHDVGSMAAAIRCTDGASLLHQSKAEYRPHLAHLRAQSPLFANVWAKIPLACHGYAVRPKWRFAGPFGANITAATSADPPAGGDQSDTVPLLFATQTLDPVTPRRNAVAAARLFPGSQLLEAQGVGHSSLGYLNPCALQQIALFFRTGRVAPARPGEEWLKCPPSEGPFDEPEPEARDAGAASRTERAARQIAESWTRKSGGLTAGRIHGRPLGINS